MSLAEQNVLADSEILRRERPGNFKLFREFTDTKKDWLVRGFLGAGEASAWYGVPGCGKSVLVEDMALHISAGRDWHGRTVRGGSVLYVALERAALVERRAVAFKKHHGLTDLPFALVGGVFDFRDVRGVIKILEIADAVSVESGQDLGLIVIDTLSRALCGGDENASTDMGKIVAATSRLNATGAHILWVHHMPQEGSGRLRGHGALLGAMDTTVHVEKFDHVRTATIIKANDAEEGERVAFNLESVVIGEDTTAPVVIAEDAAKAKTPKNERLNPRQRRAKDALVEAVAEHGRTAAGLDLPQDAKVVRLECWKELLLTKSVIERDSKNQRQDFKRLKDALADKGHIAIHGDYIWVVR